MRVANRLPAINSISYSFDDKQVLNLVRLSFIAGVVVSASIMIIALKVLY